MHQGFLGWRFLESTMVAIDNDLGFLEAWP